MPVSEREAPVQGNAAGRCPWDVHVQAWQVYAALGHGNQSAERIAERGGFGWAEMVRLLAERNPWSRDGWEPLSEDRKGLLSRLRAANAEAMTNA